MVQGPSQQPHSKQPTHLCYCSGPRQKGPNKGIVAVTVVLVTDANTAISSLAPQLMKLWIAVQARPASCYMWCELPASVSSIKC